MYISVLFKKEGGIYGGRAWTYKTELPVKVGDKLIAPVGKNNAPKDVQVVEINVPDGKIDDHIQYKEITRYQPDKAAEEDFFNGV